MSWDILSSEMLTMKRLATRNLRYKIEKSSKSAIFCRYLPKDIKSLQKIYFSLYLTFYDWKPNNTLTFQFLTFFKLIEISLFFVLT